MCPAKILISLRICAVWSESSLDAFRIAKDATICMRTTKTVIRLHDAQADLSLCWEICQKVRFLRLRLIFIQFYSKYWQHWWVDCIWVSDGKIVLNGDLRQFHLTLNFQLFKQTVQTLIRRLIWLCTVCQCPKCPSPGFTDTPLSTAIWRQEYRGYKYPLLSSAARFDFIGQL